LHFEAIEEYFPSPIHRLGFAPIKNYKFPRYPNRIKLGKWGENWAIYYLIHRGYKYIQRNYFAGKFGEIDIIMKKDKNCQDSNCCCSKIFAGFEKQTKTKIEEAKKYIKKKSSKN